MRIMTALPAAPVAGGRKATRDDWLDVALRLLARRGIGAVAC